MPHGRGGCVLAALAVLSAAAAPLLAQTPFELWGATGRPVVTAPGNQTASVGVGDGAGGVIVAWQDDRSSTHVPDVYVQRLDSTGAPRWLLDGVVIGAAPGTNGLPESQGQPAIASDGAGGAIVAWHDNRNLQDDVYAQRVASHGAPLWQTNGVPLGTACWPGGLCANRKQGVRLTTDGAGGAILAWYELRDGFNFSVWAQRVRADGTPAWTIDGVPVASGDFYAMFPEIAPDGAGGAYVAWLDHRGTHVGLYAQRLDPSGTPLWPANGIAVASSLAANGPSAQRVAADGTGGAILAWVDGRNDGGSNADIFAQRLGPDGAALWAPGGLAVCTRLAHQYYPVVAADGAGGAVVAWEDQGTAPAGSGQQWVMAQRVDAGGSTLWPAGGAVVHDRHSGGATILPDGAGGALLAFDGFREGLGGFRPALVAQRIDAGGQRLWTSAGYELYWEPTGHQGFGPQLVGDGAGGFVVHWTDYRFTGGTQWDVFAQRVGDQGPPPPAVAADLSVTLAASPDPVVVGGNLTYSATVSNAGPGPAPLVAANAEVPPATTLRLVTTDQGVCHPGTVSCALGTIPAGGRARITFVVRPQAPLGTVTTTLFAASNAADPREDDNAGAATTAVLPATTPPPTAFHTLDPCRLLDTRGPDGPYGGPRLFAGSPRVFELVDRCLIPRSALAVSANVTVTAPTGAGYVVLYPGYGGPPGVSTVNFRAGQTRANNVVLPLDDDGRVSAYVGPGGSNAFAHVVVDVNGYFQ